MNRIQSYLLKGLILGLTIGSITMAQPIQAMATASNMWQCASGMALGASQLVFDASRISAKALEYPRTAFLLAAGAAGLGSYALYAYRNYCDQDCAQLIKDAQQITGFLSPNSLDQVGKPNQLMFWRNCPEVQSRAGTKNYFAAPADIRNNNKDAYDCLKQDWSRKLNTSNDGDFRRSLSHQIDNEKTQINSIRQRIANKITKAPGKYCIDAHLKNLSLHEGNLMSLLRAEDITAINAAIKSCYGVTINPMRWAKKIVQSSFEADLVEQYWKLTLLLARLDSLEAVIKTELI